MWWLIRATVLLSGLLLLSVEDFRTRRVNISGLVLLSVVALLLHLLEGTEVVELGIALLPAVGLGILYLLMPGRMGVGDIWVVGIIGLFEGGVFTVWCVVIGAVMAFFRILFGKFWKGEIALVPYLLLASEVLLLCERLSNG